jgi:hypothetical protein
MIDKRFLERLRAPDCVRYVEGVGSLLEERPPLPQSPRQMMKPRD